MSRPSRKNPRMNSKDVDVAALGAAIWTDVGGSVRYQHVRGPSENAGNTTYSVGTFYGYGMQALVEASAVTFNSVQVRFASTATSENVRCRVYQVDNATGFNPAGGGSGNTVLLADRTILATQIPHGTASAIGDVICYLGGDVTVGANKYVMVVITSATVGVLSIPMWNNNTPADRMGFALMTSASAASMSSIPTYASVPPILMEASPDYAALLYQAQSAASSAAAAATSVTAATALVAAGATGDASDYWEHPRGATERAGNSTYQSGGFYGYGFRQVMAEAIRFDRVVVSFKSSATTEDVRVRVYSMDTTGSTFAFAGGAGCTLLADTTVLAANVPHGASPADVTVLMPSRLSIAAGKVLVVYVTSATAGAITIAQWNNNTPGDRIVFYIATSTTASTTSSATTYFSASMVVADGGSARLAASIKTNTDAIAALQAGGQSVETPRLVLPATLYAVPGDNLQIFTRPCIEAFNPANMPNTFICPKGATYPRYWEWTPVSGDAGANQTLNLKTYKMDGTLRIEANATVKTKSPASPGSAKRIMIVGDSLTAGGDWATELRRRLVGTGGSPAASALTNISFRGNTAFTSAPTEGYFGYGGWTMGTWINATPLIAFWVTAAGHNKDVTDQKAVYLDANGKTWFIETIQTGQIKMIARDGQTTIPASGNLTWVSGGTHTTTIAYSASAAAAGTPFWDGSAFSIKTWSDTYDSSLYPDMVIVLLGWNSVATGTGLPADHASAMAHYQTFITKVHTEFASAKIVLLGLQNPSPTGGLGANYGAAGGYSDYYTMLRRANGWNMALAAKAAEAGNTAYTYFVDVASQFDSENGHPTAANPLNNRVATTELRGTNGIHPNTSGYMQIADIAYRAVVNLL